MNNFFQNSLLVKGFAFTSVFLFLAPQGQAQTPAPTNNTSAQVLARINSRTLTVAEFNKRYEQNSQIVPGKAPAKAEVLKNIIYFELATQEAKKLKLDQDPSLKEQFDILLYQALVRRTVQPKIDALEVSENEVKNYYQANPLLRTSHIIVLAKPGMSPQEVKDLKDRAGKILDTVKNSKKSFEDVAREYSEGPSAKTGGDVDWGARHKLLPEYYDAALALKNVGDISGVVETPFGYHILKLTGKKAYSEIDAVYKDFIIRTLRESKGQGIYNAYFEDLKKRSKVSINESLLN